MKAKVDAPFNPQILDQARKIASGYRYIIRPHDTLGYMGRSLEFPLVFAHGSTHEECLNRTLFAVETTVATMLERGEFPPASSNRRTEQINIRLTSEEKLILEEESHRRGFEGLSDFVRATALGQAGGTSLLKK